MICYNGLYDVDLKLLETCLSNPFLFKWRYFQADIILCAVRWYLRYALSYRDLEELLREWGVSVDHTTIVAGYNAMPPNLPNGADRT